MNKRKANSVAYTGPDTFSSNLEVEVTNWGSNVTANVAKDLRSGVPANWELRSAADVANVAQPVGAINWGLSGIANVAKEPRSGVPCSQLGTEASR